MDINELLEPNAKKAVFTFGRFNPPTKGHARLMDVVKNASSGADHYVFTGRTNDPKKNPLQYKDKITFLSDSINWVYLIKIKKDTLVL